MYVMHAQKPDVSERDFDVNTVAVACSASSTHQEGK
jgi:hypothetical protein